MKLQRLYVFVSAVAIGAFSLAGCQGQAEIEHPEVPTDTEGQHVHEHGHGHDGPHGGHIIELGDEQYHAELVHDEDAHKVTVYILDGSAEKAAPIAVEALTINLVADGKPAQFTLAPEPLEGEADGVSSRFGLESEDLLHEMEEEGSNPRLTFTIGDQQFNGNIEIEEHDHDHGEGEHHDHDDDHAHEEAGDKPAE